MRFPRLDEVVNGKVHETLALTIDHDTAIIRKYFGISEELKAFILFFTIIRIVFLIHS